jgi:hypothetical protein
MARRHNSIRNVLLAGSMLAAWPVLAADVTPERLLNPDKEPQNWLMNHRTYDGQRFSPLARINKGNVKGLKLAYAVPLGGSAGNEYVEATPLVENGAITPPAPGRFSITIAGPCARPICSASRRAKMSALPPGGYGTTILIVLVG